MRNWAGHLQLLVLLVVAASALRCGSEDFPSTRTPAARPTGTTEPAASNSVELPRDSQGYWSLEGVIRGKRLAVVEYYPNAASAEERRTKQARLGLLDLQTTQVEVIGELQPGEQVAQNANDGRFLGWTEAGVPGVKDMAWKLYAEEPGVGDRWLVASGGSSTLTVKPYGSALSVDGGRLVYASENSDGSGTTLKLVDLQSHDSKDVATASGGAAVISVALNGSSLGWVSAASGPGGTVRTLHLLNMASGVEKELGQDFTSVAIGEPGLVAAGQSVELFKPGSSSAIPIGSASQGSFDVQVIGASTAWIDLSRHRPMVASLTDATPKPSLVADEYAGRLFTNGDKVYWMAAPDLDKGAPATHLYVRWRDIP